MLSAKKIRINLHCILTKDKLNYYISLLSNPPEWLNKINAIIFLNYKPTNGNLNLTLNNADKTKVKLFFDTILSVKFCSIGFDTCTASFIEHYTNIDKSLFDFCESARRSAYINENLDVYPCSFYKGVGRNLREASLEYIWTNDKLFLYHRNQLELCHNCSLYNINFSR